MSVSFPELVYAYAPSVSMLIYERNVSSPKSGNKLEGNKLEEV